MGVYTAQARNGQHLPYAPSNFAIDSTEATTATVSWFATEERNRPTGEINAFYVFARTDSNQPTSFDVNLPGDYQAPGSDWETASTFTLNFLDKNTDYWLWVGAHNDDGTSPLTGPIMTKTDSTPSDPVVGLDVDTITNNSLRVFWSAPEDTGGIDITGYNLYKSDMSADPTSDDIVATLPADQFSWTATGLDPNMAYYFWVGAINADGETLSMRADGTTDPEATTPPQNVAFSDVTATSLTFSWDAPSFNGGADVEGYNLFFSESSTKPAERTTAVEADVFTFSFSSLTRYTTYFVWVEAVNVAGVSDASVVASQMTDSTVPTPVTLTVVADSSSQFTATWTAPSDDGGLGIDRYEVFISMTSTKPAEASHTTSYLTYSAMSLTRATVYYVWVQAVNGDGPSVTATFVPVVTFSTVPSVPQSVSAVASSSTVAIISWNAPADNGGEAISTYEVYIS